MHLVNTSAMQLSAFRNQPESKGECGNAPEPVLQFEQLSNLNEGGQ
jgi:hypothetical protein